MPTTERPGGVRARLFVREALPTPATQSSQRTIARLERLTSEGLLDGYSVTSWDKRLPVDGADAPEQRRRYNEFSDWARSNGARLTPFFDTRECYSMETGEKRTELVFPAICLALYEDGDLRTVAPHAAGSETESVADCLDRLVEQSTDEPVRRTTVTAD
ncbi:HTH domain-containing protein [Halomicrobium sp. HM KBTZ05]|uniref:HTH domain-containing protein n=1 Tax=Halomicrobium sp. HM KBTZ05 TaxID=3242663 RepID=UPI003559276F